MLLGIVFSLLGIGMLMALMFNMAILALPVFVAVAAGRFAYDTGAGAMGAIVSSDIRNPSTSDTDNPSTSATVTPERVPVRVSP